MASKVWEAECSSLQRLKHPGIVELISGGRDSDTRERYVVLPWLGGDLSVLIGSAEPKVWEDHWQLWGERILSALAHAHGQEVAHRDIKPSNIMLRKDGQPCLTDFGIAKLVSQAAPGLTLRDHSTRPFCPPEFDAGNNPYQRDVYSFGVLALTSLSGIDPFSDADDPYRPVRMSLDQCSAPPDVCDVLSDCIDESPEKRPRSAGEVLSRLQAIGYRHRPTGSASSALPLALTSKARERLSILWDVETEILLNERIADELADDPVMRKYQTEKFKDGSSTAGHFHLIGSEISLHVAADYEKGCLYVLSAKLVDNSALEIDRDRGWHPKVSFQVREPTRDEIVGESLRELIAGLEEFETEAAIERRKNLKERPLAVWRRTLRALREIESQRELPIKYSKVEESGSGFRFTTTDNVPDAALGETRVVRSSNRLAGTGVITDIDKRFVTIQPVSGNFSRLSGIGELVVDTAASRAAISRQESALDHLRYGRSVRPELKDFLLEPSAVGHPAEEAPTSWFQDFLDESKRSAVAKALGASDLFLVQGPPGTGKTTFIAEIVLQHLKKHPRDRILVSSQTHAALDNILERIGQVNSDLSMLRIAKEDDTRVAEGAAEYLVGEQLRSWASEVETQGKDWLSRWADANGVDVQSVELAITLEELADLLDEKQAMETRLSDIERRALDSDEEPLPPEARLGLEEQRLATSEALASAETQFARVFESADESFSDKYSSHTPEELRAASDDVLPNNDEATRARDLVSLIAEWKSRFGRGRTFESAAIVRSQVVAATCVGYAAVPGSESIEFDLCIIDEASKANATELLVPLIRAKRWLLVGDDRQLPPFVDEALSDPELLREFRLSADDLEESLFRKLKSGLDKECVTSLDLQHRMLPAIGEMISHCFYGGNLQSAPASTPNWVTTCLGAPVVWRSTSRMKNNTEFRSGTSWGNRVEVQVISQTLDRLQFAADSIGSKISVAVLSGYATQKSLIEHSIFGRRHELKNLDIECNTVDAFQGREADVVIYSATRSNEEGSLGFLRDERRLNVALSRGRKACVIVGNHERVTQSSHNNPFRKVLAHIEDEQECELEEVQL